MIAVDLTYRILHNKTAKPTEEIKWILRIGA
jgi:hypothetical protein